MNILFICTSNKDRSPALEAYFEKTMPEHKYQTAGVNRYFTGLYGTHYLEKEDISRANIVFAEPVHAKIFARDFPGFIDIDEKNIELGHLVIINFHGANRKAWMILCEGEYKAADDDVIMEYLTIADEKIKRVIKTI